MKTVHKAALGGAAAITMAASFIMPWEGLWTTAKVDRIGTGHPITWCYGETVGGAKVGDKFTPQQCADMLVKRLPRYNEEISQCINVPISDTMRAAFISGAYNFGSGLFCHSSIVRRLNAGDYRGACDALLAFDRAGGVEVRGLKRRREAERNLCIEGIQ